MLKIRKRQLARSGIVEEGKEVPDFSVIVDFFDSSFKARFETKLLIPPCDGKPEDFNFLADGFDLSF